MSPARRRLFLMLMTVVAVAALVVGGVAIVATLGGGVAPVAQDLPGPVLLVPGYGGSTESLEVLAQDLREAGRDATVVALAGDGTGDLGVQAGVLADAAEAALQRTGAPSVDVVGYSAGGVVTRLWLREGGGAALTRRVVTLGSPHHGTSIAGLAVSVLPDQCPTACRQLVPGSDLLRALNAGDETPEGPGYVSIWTTDDETVTPPDSARLDGALNLVVQDVCPGTVVSHSDLPRNPVVGAMVLREIGAEATEALDAGDCASLS
ncbi:MAG: lipase [Geodermatophilaceae bacterium]|nr:lipase [Geodermatophilaceae bacterium]